MLEALLGAALRSLVLTIVVWLGLRARRLRNPHIRLAAWTMVLAASIAMPAVTPLAALVLPPAPLVAPAFDRSLPLRLDLGLNAQHVSAAPAGEGAAPASGGAARPGASPQSASAGSPWSDWRAFAMAIYLAVAAVLLIRLTAGLLLTSRVVRRAKPVREMWTNGRDIRVSADVAAPATFGSTILLPEGYADWSQMKRGAVLSHEAAHVRRGDFYVQVAACFNRAIFWFNPWGWWLRRRLSELAEAASDDEAIGDLRDDRPLYAQILLEVSCRSPILPSGVAMARPATLRARIERVLSESKTSAPIGKRACLLLAAAILPVTIMVAGPLAARSTDATQSDFPSLEQQQAPHLRIAIDPKLLDADAGFYEDMAKGTVMTVAREDDHLVTTRTGRSRVDEYPYTEHDFFLTISPEQDTFVADESGNVVRVIHHKYGLATTFERISADTAAELEADFERRLAEELALHTPTKIEASALDRYVGDYQLTPTYYFSVTREGDQLFAQGTDQKKFAVYPYSDHDFFYTVVAAQLTFQTAANGAATALILHQDGRDRTAKRVTAEAAQEFQQRLADELKPRTAVSIDQNALQRYVGRYTGPVISMTITRDGDRLYAQVWGFNRFRVYPYSDHDFFATTFPAQISFLEDPKTRAVQLVRHEHGVDLVLNRLN